jgi:hypothetical protein
MGLIFLRNRLRTFPHNVAMIRASLFPHEKRRTPGSVQARADNDTGADNHGVSDPTGQARGEVERTCRGRSRHDV